MSFVFFTVSKFLSYIYMYIFLCYVKGRLYSVIIELSGKINFVILSTKESEFLGPCKGQTMKSVSQQTKSSRYVWQAQIVFLQNVVQCSTLSSYTNLDDKLSYWKTCAYITCVTINYYYSFLQFHNKNVMIYISH